MVQKADGPQAAGSLVIKLMSACLLSLGVCHQLCWVRGLSAQQTETRVLAQQLFAALVTQK